MNRHSMPTFLLLLSLISCRSEALGQTGAKLGANKQSVLESVGRRSAELIRLSDAIWSFEEIACQETRSSAALADYADANGFRVQRGVAGIPTAFGPNIRTP